MKRIAVVVFGVVALALTLAPARVMAQEASPVAGPAGGIVPGPEECTGDPISVERLTALAATPVPATPETAASPEAAPASPTPFAMPAGQPADDATIAEITAVIVHYIACINAGDVLRILGLYTDRALVDVILSPLAELTPEEIIAAFASPQPLPENERTILYSVDQMLVLPDGRVAALITGDDLREPNPPGPALLFFVETVGGWRVDGFVPTEDIAGEPGS